METDLWLGEEGLEQLRVKRSEPGVEVVIAWVPEAGFLSPFQ